MEASVVIAIVSALIAATALVTNLIDRIKRNTKESNLELIKYRLDELDKSVQKILDKLDKYETEVDEKIAKALETHVAMYHKRTKKGE